MSSIRCPECNLINFATAVACKRCSCLFQPSANGVAAATSANYASSQTSFGGGQHRAAQSGFENDAQSSAASYNQPPQQHQYFEPSPARNYYQQPPHYQTYQTGKQKSGLAIASMVFGLIGCFFTAPIGLILGIVAMVKANRRPHEYGGKGFAIAGIVLNGLGLLFLPVIAAIAIPNLMAARRAANEAGAINTVRKLIDAEQSYMASMYGKCGDVQTLIATKLLDVSLAKNEKFGYRFTITNLPESGCEIHATPLTTSQGTRSFFYSTADGEIRAADHKGLPAGLNDAPLGVDIPNAKDENDTLWGQPPSERGAIANLKTLYAAEMTYAATAGSGNCGDFPALAREKLIKADLADGESGGYRYAVKKLVSYGCELTATPTSTSYPSRSFHIASDGVMRGKAKNGLPADKGDPLVE